MTEYKVENLLKSWDPSKDSKLFKEKLWQQIQEELESEELSEEDLDFVSGGIRIEEKNKKDYPTN